MHRYLLVALLTLLFASCSARDVRESWQRGWSTMDWNIQRHIFESDAAWEQGTGRAVEHDRRGN